MLLDCFVGRHVCSTHPVVCLLNEVFSRSVGLSRQGTIEGHKHSYQLDQGHVFETGRRTAVCGNTAAMLGEGGASWLSRHFEVRLCIPTY